MNDQEWPAGVGRRDPEAELLAAVEGYTRASLEKPPGPCAGCGQGGGCLGAIGLALFAIAAAGSLHWLLSFATHTVLGLAALGMLLTQLPRQVVARRGG